VAGNADGNMFQELRFREYYGHLADDELARIALRTDELIPEALQALKEELQKRGLADLSECKRVLDQALQPPPNRGLSTALEEFAAIERRYRQIGYIPFFGIVAILPASILAASFSPQSALPLLGPIVGLLLILGAGIAEYHIVRCPNCNSYAMRKGKYCPECGARSLSKQILWLPRMCAACGRVLGYRRATGRLYKVRYCGCCGCHLHEQGL
jgi:hypothetical protein